MSLQDETKVGVWRAFGEFKLREAIWPEGLLAIVIGVGGASAALHYTPLHDRVSTIGDLLFLSGALLAVVFTALAIMVSLPSTSYFRMLQETPEGGMRRFLEPFLVAVGTQIGVVLLGLGYRLLAAHVGTWAERVAFDTLGFLFVFGLLDIAALARQLVRHGIYRAADAAMSYEEESGRPSAVRKLPSR
jgi:hypothetical protein